MISGVPLFRGRDNQDQLLHIMRIIGTPDDRVLRKIATDSVCGCKLPLVFVVTLPFRQPEVTIKQYPKYPKISFQQVLPKASPQGMFSVSNYNSLADLILTAIDLLERLLQFDPSKRITATEALSHPYFTSTASPAYGPSPTPGSMPPPQFNFPHPHAHAHHQPQSQVQQQPPPQAQQIIVQQPGQQLVAQQPGYPPHPQSMFVAQDAARMQAQVQAQAQAMAQAQAAHAHAQAQAAHVGQQGYTTSGYPAQYQHSR